MCMGPVGIGGNEFHQHLFPLAVVGAAIIRSLVQYVGHRRRIKGGGQEKVEEAGARYLRPFKKGAGQIQAAAMVSAIFRGA